MQLNCASDLTPRLKRGACALPFDERRRRKTEKGQNRLLAADSSFEGRSACSWAPEKKDFTETVKGQSKWISEDLRQRGRGELGTPCRAFCIYSTIYEWRFLVLYLQYLPMQNPFSDVQEWRISSLLLLLNLISVGFGGCGQPQSQDQRSSSGLKTVLMTTIVTSLS